MDLAADGLLRELNSSVQLEAGLCGVHTQGRQLRGGDPAEPQGAAEGQQGDHIQLEQRQQVRLGHDNVAGL